MRPETGWRCVRACGLDILTDLELDLPRSDSRCPGVVIRRGRGIGRAVDRWIAIDEGIGCAWISRDGREVVFAPVGAVPPSVVQSFVLGVVALQLLALQGVICLHGSAVRLGESAVALVAPSGYGKSTITAALMREGGELMADDLVPLREAPDAFWVLPTYPSLRLWDDALRFLGVDFSARPLAHGYRNKYVLTAPVELGRWSAENTRLRRVYLLRREAGHPPERPAAPTPAALMLELLRHTLRPAAMTDGLRRAQFVAIAALADQVETRFLHVPPRLSELPAIVRAILDDLAEVPDAV